MLGFWKRRRLAREQAAEAARKKLREQVGLADRQERIAGRQSGGHPASVLQHDPLYLPGPLSPLIVANSIGFGSPETARERCFPVVSGDSWPSSGESAQGCSVPTYESTSYEPASL